MNATWRLVASAFHSINPQNIAVTESNIPRGSPKMLMGGGLPHMSQVVFESGKKEKQPLT